MPSGLIAQLVRRRRLEHETTMPGDEGTVGSFLYPKRTDARDVAPAATSNCTRRGHFKMYQPERSGFYLRICLCRGCRLPVSSREAVLVQTVALAADLDQMRVVHEPIEECGNGRSVAEELGPVVERAV